MKLLIIEDNLQVAQFLSRGLNEAGYLTDHAGDGARGLLLARSRQYDAIVMDRLLPDGIDGIDLIASLRDSGNLTPILILSALSLVNERVRGLKSGGDDYMVKPFAFSELLARLDVLTRRLAQTARQPAQATVLSVGALSMDLLTHTVRRGTRPVTLQAREFRLLEYLMRHADQLVTRTMLFENVWNVHFEAQSNVIDVQVCKLRHKIDGAGAPPHLLTIRSLGYKLSSGDE